VIARHKWRTARIGRGLVLLAALTQLSACHTAPPRPDLPLYRHHDAAPVLEPVDVLAITPQMQGFVQRYVSGHRDSSLRISLLNTAVSGGALLGFRYDARKTLTAQEAFEQRTGNCLAYSNLVVALAREAGLNARYQEVMVAPEWQAREDTVVVSRHVNVLIRSGDREWMMDPTGLVLRPGDRRRTLSDAEAQAMYYNNLAVDAMVGGDHQLAHARLAQSVAVAPELSDTWVNLGVLYGRNGQLDEAAMIYRNTLAHDPDQYSALVNLLALYEAVEDVEAAMGIAPRVERYRQRNPYYLMFRAEEAMELGDYDRSRDLLQRAIELRPEEHRFHFALARTEYLAGDPVSGEASLARARELAPADVAADYQRPLAELSATP